MRGRRRTVSRRCGAPRRIGAREPEAGLHTACEILAPIVVEPDEGIELMGGRRQMTVTPSAARLTGSLRDIGYDFPSAVADLVDNSIAAGACRIEIEMKFAGAGSRVVVADDGQGMTANGVVEALRFGSRRNYPQGDLGRYGLGLKTASLSQCRVLTVASRRPESGRTSVRQLDLDLIEDWDEWLVVDPGRSVTTSVVRDILDRGFSTVIVWDRLDRVLPEKADGGWAKRRFEALVGRTCDHLAMVFHRFLEGRIRENPIVIVVNGVKLRPWDPFAWDEPATIVLPEQAFELTVGDVTGAVTLTRHILPARDAFSSPAEFDRLSGPLKWNRQQGLHIYRAGRLVQWGGWAGVRAIDEHTKLARAALFFDTDLDPAFNINVAKMRVTVPPQLRQMLERPIHELCNQAGDAYRKTSRTRGNLSVHAVSHLSSLQGVPAVPPAVTAGLALRSAAIQAGEYKALKRIAALLGEQAPEVAAALGLEHL